MIVVTGAAGFIGSCLVNKLNNKGFKDLVVVDDFGNAAKNKNLESKVYRKKVDRMVFFEWLRENHQQINFIFHIGARTDTTEFNVAVFDELNLNYSKEVWRLCAAYGIPLVYASSAATYGDGEHGYADDHSLLDRLRPLNPYGQSKHDFDKWALARAHRPPFWAGLKFFNVYGPNEYHKGRMASVVYHTFLQIRQTGAMKLFRSHRPDIKDGEQARDFIYVKDVTNICFYLMLHPAASGIYNLGTGKARTFLDLARAAFAAMGMEPDISFIDTPEDIREKYQYYTCADMAKLLTTGYRSDFFTLEQGVQDYVQGYLQHHIYF